MRAIAIAFLCLVVPAQAKPSKVGPVTLFNGDRYAPVAQMSPSARDVTRAMDCSPMAGCSRAERRRAKKPPTRKGRRPVPIPAPRPSAEPGDVDPLSLRYGAMREIGYAAGLPRSFTERLGRGVVVGGRPSGCPSRFCGCGASLHLFGRIIPALNLAANWLRFPRSVPAPNMVAARRGHVFVLKQHIAGSKWLVHDSNSGGRRTRIHPRSIAGYTIVNPHGGASDMSARRRG